MGGGGGIDLEANASVGVVVLDDDDDDDDDDFASRTTSEEDMVPVFFGKRV